MAEHGWYPDPTDPTREWYWDGRAYTTSRPRAGSHHGGGGGGAYVASPSVSQAAPKRYSSTTVAIPVKVFGHAAKLHELDAVLEQWAKRGWSLDKVVELQTKDGALQVRDRVLLLLVFCQG